MKFGMVDDFVFTIKFCLKQFFCMYMEVWT